MIQSPLPNYTMPIQQAQIPAPEYNAIKINIVDPKVNVPGAQQTQSMYSYPQSQIYSYPQAQQVYAPQVYAQPPVQQQAQVYMMHNRQYNNRHKFTCPIL